MSGLSLAPHAVSHWPGSYILCVLSLQVSPRHANIVRKENGEYFVTDCGSEKGTWCNDKQLKPNQEVKLHPEDKLYFGSKTPECSFKVKLAHESVEHELQKYIKQIESIDAGEKENMAGAAR